MIKNKIKSSIDESLSGFEEIIDLFIDQEGPSLKRSSTKSRDNENYDMYQFLDVENRRLNDLDSLFSEKIDNKNEMSTEVIGARELKKKYEKLIFNITEALDEDDSYFLYNMEMIWNPVFKSQS